MYVLEHADPDVGMFMQYKDFNNERLTVSNAVKNEEYCVLHWLRERPSSQELYLQYDQDRRHDTLVQFRQAERLCGVQQHEIVKSTYGEDHVDIESRI